LAKIRVNKLALELGLQNDQIIEALQKKEIAVKNHMSSVDEEVAQDIRDLFAPKDPEKTAPKTVKVKVKAKAKIKIKAPSKVKITTAKTQAKSGVVKKTEEKAKPTTAKIKK
jgi:translation initiation factor IF-2